MDRRGLWAPRTLPSPSQRHQQLLGGVPFVNVFYELKGILSYIENLTSLSYMRPVSKTKEEKRKEEKGEEEGEGEVWKG